MNVSSLGNKSYFYLLFLNYQQQPGKEIKFKTITQTMDQYGASFRQFGGSYWSTVAGMAAIFSRRELDYKIYRRCLMVNLQRDVIDTPHYTPSDIFYFYDSTARGHRTWLYKT